MIKNLLFVGKVIYLISPECDVTPPQEEAKEKEEEEQMEDKNGDGEEGVDGDEQKDEEKEKEDEEDEDDDKDDRPPSLLWLMKKLVLMAKREAAYTPKVPLKVHTRPILWLTTDRLVSCYSSTCNLT